MSQNFERLPGHLNDYTDNNKVILRGLCPFCDDRVTFRRRTHELRQSTITKTLMIGVQCESCGSLCVFSVGENKLYPAPMIQGVKNLPEEIEKYYQESLRCIAADSPNGAATLFRKIIHALGIHYGIANKNDSKNLYDVIKKLHENGHIIQKIRDALLGIKDIGNDGAHINDNEPDMGQATQLKSLIDTVLTSTVICDSSLEFVKTAHSKKEE